MPKHTACLAQIKTWTMVEHVQCMWPHPMIATKKDTLCFVTIAWEETKEDNRRTLSAQSHLMALDGPTACELRRAGIVHGQVWDYLRDCDWSRVDGRLFRIWDERLIANDRTFTLEGIPLGDLWSHFVVAEVHRNYALAMAVSNVLAALTPRRCCLYMPGIDSASDLFRTVGRLLNAYRVPWCLA